MKLSNPDISVEDGTLSINNIQKTNEGYYLCEAVNGIGAGLSAVILISVQGKTLLSLFLFLPFFLIFLHKLFADIKMIDNYSTSSL